MLSTMCAGTYEDSTQAASNGDGCYRVWPQSNLHLHLAVCPVQTGEQAPSKPETVLGLPGTTSPAWTGHHKLKLYSLVQVQMDVLMPNTVAPHPAYQLLRMKAHIQLHD